MKRSILVGIMLIAAAAAAQEKTDETPLGVKVVKHGWEKVRIDWTKDPLSTPSGENYYQLRDRVTAERRQRTALEERNIKEAKEKQKPPPPPRYAFIYKLSVENRGSKAIKELDWDYVFTDAVTGEILAQREFTSLETIRPGKRKDLQISASAAPANRISVQSLNDKEREGLAGRIIIGRILYEDGSVWMPVPR